MAENGLFGTPFPTPKIPLKKFMWVPLLRSFPGIGAHKLFSGAQNGGFRVGGKKFMLKKFMCFFCPLPLFCSVWGVPKYPEGWEKPHEKWHCRAPFCVPQIPVKTSTSEEQCPHVLTGNAQGRMTNRPGAL